jgi:hypothetical protein
VRVTGFVKFFHVSPLIDDNYSWKFASQRFGESTFGINEASERFFRRHRVWCYHGYIHVPRIQLVIDRAERFDIPKAIAAIHIVQHDHQQRTAVPEERFWCTAGRDQGDIRQMPVAIG